MWLRFSPKRILRDAGRGGRPFTRIRDMEDAAARELLSALDDRDPTVIRAAMVSYADRVQGVRLQAKAYDLVARQHVLSALFAAPQLGSCASSGRAWPLWAARRSQEEACPDLGPALVSSTNFKCHCLRLELPPRSRRTHLI